ncbi:MAG TPA: hypothetical protein VLB27_02755 [candidate division Zixibacteria bacterium]|nr:hypothetical protein [candidate division Zixibacteria bacterium]
MSALAGSVAVRSSALDRAETVELSGALLDYSVSNFRSGRLYTFKFDNYPGEFVAVSSSSFPADKFDASFVPGMSVHFRIRATDTIALAQEQRSEIVELSSAGRALLSLDDWNREVMATQRLVAGVIAATLALATAALVWLWALSPRREETVEEWERFRVS